mgnify:CR=1 FL=1
MSKSFTPGLKVLKKYIILKDRILPVRGKVITEINNVVSADDIVASTNIPGNVKMINIANKLNIEPSYLKQCMLVEVGDNVTENQVIAQSKGLFGLFKTEIKSPVIGEITQISEITGQIVISEPPDPIEIDAYIPGKINKVYKQEGVQIRSAGTYIQGIIGIGGEKKGQLKVISNSSGPIKLEDISSDYKNCIIVMESFLEYDIYQKAKEVGVSGIITGGFNYESLSEILGYSLGVAITGTEAGLTIIITEGFGNIKMSQKTYDLLLDNNDKYISINGSTQIRAGVLRPEIFIHDDLNQDELIKYNQEDLVIDINSKVRIIREPYFGKLGKIISLPYELQKMKSGTLTRVAEILFDDGSSEIIPRTNLEVILSD